MANKRTLSKNRRRPPELSQEHAWLLTYSDAMTLLLAFFVMILAVSELDQGKIEALKQGVIQTMSTEKISMPFTNIENSLKQLIEEQQIEDHVQVAMDLKGVKLEFANYSLYESGSAEILPEAQLILQHVTDTIKDNSQGVAYLIEVEGHTDDMPIHTDLYPTNWELSANRATNVVKFFIQHGIKKEILKASGYADSRPKTPLEANQDIEEWRANNRRVVIYIKRQQL